MNFETK